MDNHSFRNITSWNASGLFQQVQELEIFLQSNNIHFAMISKTHFTEKNRGGTAIIVKQNILHFNQEKIRD